MTGKKKIAVIVTEYRYNSHADVILGRLLGDFGYQPQVEVVSLYTDQVPENDMSREMAGRRGIPIYGTIRDCIRAEHIGEPIDGIVIIGEHGKYPNNEKGQTLYPRRRMLEESIHTLDELGLRVPIFSDKFLSHDVEDALWMYGALKQRGIPFMGGSSIPHTDPVPAYDSTKVRTLREIVVISHSTLLEAYGFHALEVMQAVAEQRQGGESGVRSVEVIHGEEVWAAMERGDWPEDLMLAALAAYPELEDAHPREKEPSPFLMMVDYLDGTKANVIQFRSLVEQWGFACRNREGEIIAALQQSQLERPFNHFERFTRLIEEMMLTGKPPFPMERTLLTTILTAAVIDSHYYKQRVAAPELAISYQPEEATK